MPVKCNLRISRRIMYVVTDAYKIPSRIPDRPNGCLAAVFLQPRLNFLRYVATLGTDKLRYIWKVVSCGLFEGTNNSITDHSDRAVEIVGLRPLNCWNCGFESHRGFGCLSLVSVVR
jgi:hypothetical protein